MNGQTTEWLRGLVMPIALAFAGCSDSGSGTGAMTGAGIGAAGLGTAPTGGVSGQNIGVGTAGAAGTPSSGRAGTVAGIGGIGTAAGGGGTSAASGGTSAASGGMGAATGGNAAGASGSVAATGGMGAAAGGSAAGSGGVTPPSGSGCTPAPTGTFETMTAMGGPNGDYVVFRPVTLGENGFKHPPVAWGNGLSTVPSQYMAWLNKVASNGFVVIANPGTGSDPQVVRQGLEWLIAQGKSGEYAGKLAENCAGTIGYSMGGGAAVGAGAHPEVRAVVSVHGLQDAAENVQGPLLLTTSNDDGFVTPEGFVMPCYNRSSKQPTILATYITTNTPSIAGHLTPLGDGQQDADPTIAWLRFWLYGDQAQKKWFYGADCTLCVKPWGMIQRKNGNWD